MRIPRDLSGKQLIMALRIMGYSQTRQTGSHIRLSTEENGVHHITIPNHDPLKIGTLSAILADVANHFNLSKEELLTRIF
jgi:predicted RNA binding protein YcfA (HicA-like mRNA interferase family)